MLKEIMMILGPL